MLVEGTEWLRKYTMKNYDNWLAAPYEYPNEECFDCWCENNPDADDDEKDSIESEFDLCERHIQEARDAYMEDCRDEKW